MNLESLQKKLLAAAKASPPVDRVPMAFEKRVLANLNVKPAIDLAALWSRALWRATVPCLALALILVGVATLSGSRSKSVAVNNAVITTTTVTNEDLSVAFERSLLASSDQTMTLDFLEEN